MNPKLIDKKTMKHMKTMIKSRTQLSSRLRASNAPSAGTPTQQARRRCSAGSLCILMLILSSAPALFRAHAKENEKNTVWPSAGQNLDNTRFNAAEETISAANASGLAVKWVFQTAGDVSATPAVDKKHVYFPDWGGKLYSLNRKTGKAAWAKSIAEYTGVADSVSRVTPVIAGNTLIFGTQLDSSQQGAQVIAVNKNTGDLLWITNVDNHPSAIITQS